MSGGCSPGSRRSRSRSSRCGHENANARKHEKTKTIIFVVSWFRVFVMIRGGLMLAEYASMPIALQPIPTRTPPVYADLLRDRGDSPDAVIVEYPTSDRPQPNMALHDATYMFYSTAHWQKLLNGYSGFFPASY